jgi:hypothetical protein
MSSHKPVVDRYEFPKVSQTSARYCTKSSVTDHEDEVCILHN